MYLFLLCIIYFFDSYEEPIMPSLFLLAKEKFEFILQYLKYLRFFRL